MTLHAATRCAGLRKCAPSLTLVGVLFVVWRRMVHRQEDRSSGSVHVVSRSYSLPDAAGISARRCGRTSPCRHVRALAEIADVQGMPRRSSHMSERSSHASLTCRESWLGIAALRAARLQPSGPNNFPGATHLPRATNSVGLPVLHCVAAAARCSPSDPCRTDHRQGRSGRPCKPRHGDHHDQHRHLYRTKRRLYRHCSHPNLERQGQVRPQRQDQRKRARLPHPGRQWL